MSFRRYVTIDNPLTTASVTVPTFNTFSNTSLIVQHETPPLPSPPTCEIAFMDPYLACAILIMYLTLKGLVIRKICVKWGLLHGIPYFAVYQLFSLLCTYYEVNRTMTGDIFVHISPEIVINARSFMIILIDGISDSIFSVLKFE